ncbi:MAG: AAA family ATPase, partial [bacterium]
MGQGILIIAESGAGKSTSIEALDPQETFIINVANKALPFKGWRKKYTVWSKENVAGNLFDKATPDSIEACLRYVSEKRPEIKNVVIDDFQYMSSFEFFDKVDEKGYEKFTKIGAHLARVARLPKDLRDDLMVFILTHAEESTDMEGKRKFKAKTIGRMVDEKLTLEGLFSIVLFGKVKKNKEGVIRYVFETQTN